MVFAPPIFTLASLLLKEGGGASLLRSELEPQKKALLSEIKTYLVGQSDSVETKLKNIDQDLEADYFLQGLNYLNKSIIELEQGSIKSACNSLQEAENAFAKLMDNFSINNQITSHISASYCNCGIAICYSFKGMNPDYFLYKACEHIILAIEQIEIDKCNTSEEEKVYENIDISYITVECIYEGCGDLELNTDYRNYTLTYTLKNNYILGLEKLINHSIPICTKNSLSSFKEAVEQKKDYADKDNISTMNFKDILEEDSTAYYIKLRTDNEISTKTAITSDIEEDLIKDHIKVNMKYDIKKGFWSFLGFHKKTAVDIDSVDCEYTKLKNILLNSIIADSR